MRLSSVDDRDAAVVGRGASEEEEEEEEDASRWSGEDGGGAGAGGAAAPRRRYRRARVLVASLLNKLHNGSARAVDPDVARALRQREARLLSLQCFIEQGSIDRYREQKRDCAASSAPATGVSKWLRVCGVHAGPGAVMREWDELTIRSAQGGTSEALAMREYVELVDAMLPRWDASEPGHAVTPADCFWQDDASTTQCQYCGALFSSTAWPLQPHRRHHCRLCLAIFCGGCSAQSVPLALCPGAPVRPQRVCHPCFQRAQHDAELAASRSLMRENRALERQLLVFQEDVRRRMDAKRRREDALRLEAGACGCDMDAIDAAVTSRLAHMGGGGVGHGSSGVCESPLASSPAVAVTLALDTPPAHRFAPTRASAEAAEQLTLANRQLQMALRAAQCRARRALAQMDAVLDELRGAVSTGAGAVNGGAGSSEDIWSAVLLRTRRGSPSVGAFLTLLDLKALARTCSLLRQAVAHHKCEAKCVLAHDVAQATPAVARASVWQAECLRDDKTLAYVLDLADEVRARLDSSASSASSSSSLDGSDPSGDGVPPPHRWLQLLSSDDLAASVWHRAYALILARCELGDMEFDAQIQCDVQRTFGASALRRTRPARKVYASSSASQTPASPTGVESRRQALTNVLRAFACVNSEIGYCQGMDHVAALVLSVADWDETRSFWLFTSLVTSRHYELDLLFGPGLPRLSLRCFQLEQLVTTHLPPLAQHLAELEFPISMFATGWFMTLFTNMEALPYDVVVRVLDGFLVAGWKQLFRVALVILEALQHQLIASDFDEIPQILLDLRDYAPQLDIAEEVVARAASFKVTNSILARLQSEYEGSEGPAPTTVKNSGVALSGTENAGADGSAGALPPSPAPRSVLSSDCTTSDSPNDPTSTISASADVMPPAIAPAASAFQNGGKQRTVEVNEDSYSAKTGEGGGGKSKRTRRRRRRRSSSGNAAKETTVSVAKESASPSEATRSALPVVDV